MSVNCWEIRNVVVEGIGKPQTIGISGGEIAYVGVSQYENGGVDGYGLVALPAMIDGHVHFRHFGEDAKEDWSHGSRAAFTGGVGTVLDMGNHPEGHAVVTAEAFARKVKALGVQSIDYRLWFMALPGHQKEFLTVHHDPLLRPYLAGIKLCMERTTGNILVENREDQLAWCQVAADTDTLIAVHVGMEALIQENRARFLQPTCQDHCLIRDTRVELEGGRQFLELLAITGARGEIKHVSTPELVQEVLKARQRWVRVSLEVCPHHWIFTDEMLRREDGALFKMNPPLRTVDQVWHMQRYLADGSIDTIATDHAPHTRKEKQAVHYDEIPSGLPGVQEVLSLSLGLVASGLIDLPRFIDLTARHAARLYGLSKKGNLAAGYDADIVLLDPAQETTITTGEIESKCGWTVYNRMQGYGRPLLVVSRGVVLVNRLKHG